LTDRAVRFGSDLGGDIGPGAVISNEQGTSQVGGYNGFQGPLDMFEPSLQSMTAYNIWVDIKNGPFNQDTSVDPPIKLDTGDLYSVHVQKNGDAQRTTLFSGYLAARTPVGQADIGFTTPHLTRLVAGGIAGHSTTTNLYFDDIYLSKSGFNSTVPRAFGFTVPVTAQATPLTVKISGADVEITWSAGALEASTTLSAADWAPVANAVSPYKTRPDVARRFYRTKQ
jgi:hypothetical protein